MAFKAFERFFFMGKRKKKSLENDACEGGENANGDKFDIHELPDLRGLRCHYLPSDGGGNDSLSALPDEEHARFPLVRSTLEEARRFYRENTERGDGEKDELTELLDEL
jgi:hypothetical protein